MADKLKVCPFCGGMCQAETANADKDSYIAGYVGRSKGYYVRCLDCLANNLFNVGYETLSDAITAWNTRRTDSNLKQFAQEVIRAECWGDPMDGFDIQTLAEELGLVEPFTATEADIDEESDYEVGDVMLRFTKEMQE